MGMKRDDVYIANVMQMPSPSNRNPNADEVRELHAFSPGADPTDFTEGHRDARHLRRAGSARDGRADRRMRGRWRTARGVRVMPTFHPASSCALPSARRDVWEDMKLVRDFLAGN
jgi:DNA polymerase